MECLIAHLHHGLLINSVNKILGGFDMSIESVPYVVSKLYYIKIYRNNSLFYTQDYRQTNFI